MDKQHMPIEEDVRAEVGVGRSSSSKQAEKYNTTKRMDCVKENLFDAYDLAEPFARVDGAGLNAACDTPQRTQELKPYEQEIQRTLETHGSESTEPAPGMSDDNEEALGLVAGQPVATAAKISVMVPMRASAKGPLRTSVWVPPANSLETETFHGKPPSHAEGDKPQSIELVTPDYDVADLYYETGICQGIATNEVFGNITLFVIALNALYIGIDAEHNNASTISKSHLAFQVCEHAFCVFFTFEWLVRLGAFKRKHYSLKDAWFRFDSVLVTQMIVETWIMTYFFGGKGLNLPTSLIKMLRLCRIARLGRLMRAFPELVAMVKGLKESARAVCTALLMLLFLIYMYSIVMLVLLRGSNNRWFGTLFDSMWTLLVDGAFVVNYGAVSRDLWQNQHHFPFVILLSFVLCASLMVLNMLIGVLCDVVTKITNNEKEAEAVSLLKRTISVMLQELDESGDGLISKDEMIGVFENVEATNILMEIDVNPAHLLDHLELYFAGTDDLGIQQIMEVILMLRGKRTPTMADILHGEQYTRWSFTTILSRLEVRMRESLALKLDCIAEDIVLEIRGERGSLHQELD
jgi:voltage-gated sodium channel